MTVKRVIGTLNYRTRLACSIATFATTLVAAFATPLVTTAQVRTWTLTEPDVVDQTVALLERYYSLTRPDSARLRYVNAWGDDLPFYFRGRLASPDSVGAILSVTLGQLRLMPTDEIRVAFGEDLYARLLSIGSHASDVRDHLQWHDDWDAWRVSAALDRLAYRPTEDLRIAIQMGAPESNLEWWSDGTVRVGFETRNWSAFVLAPLFSGGSPVGPLRKRLLFPSIGAAGSVRVDRLQFNLRVAQQARYEPADSGRKCHSIGAQGTYGYALATAAGVIDVNLGVSVEEFRPVVPDSIRAAEVDIVRRLSPVAIVSWGDYSGAISAGVGVRDLSVIGFVSVHLTPSLWIDLRCTSKTPFRKREDFEHPFYLFVSPRITL